MDEIAIRIINEIESITSKKINKTDYQEYIETYGITSISYVKLVTQIEDRFGIEFEDEYLTMESLNTIQKLSEYVKNIMQT